MLRKARGFAILMLWPLALGAAGCDCDNSGGPTDEDGGVEDGGLPPVCCVNGEGMEVCVEVPPCTSPFRCDGEGFQEPTTENGCRFIAPLDPGQLATHLDIAAADGAAVLAGYSAGRNPNPRYGDLLVGRVDGDGVSWSIVDGAPAGEPIVQDNLYADPDGWRGGVTTAGDNVGEWNAIAIAPSGDIAISYYDRTNSALKYATSGDDGATWSIQTVYDVGDSGQFTSLAFLADGRPAISFLTLTPSAAANTAPTSAVQVAIGMSATPAAPTDWVVTTVGAATPVACTEALCEGDLVCRADGGCAVTSAAPATDCTFVDDEGATQPGCARGTTCVSDNTGGNFTCQALSTGEPVEDVPVANGLYTSLRATSTGLALVWHDRVRRTLRGSAFAADTSTWRAPFNIDGFDAVGTGDSGYNADLAIGSTGNWYVAYVDGVSEELRMATVDGTTIGNANPGVTRERVDDGVRGTSAPHIVGADADIAVLASGEVRIVYQDATSIEALLATRAAAATEWTLQGEGADAPIDAEDQTGFWTCQALDGDTSYIATWSVNNAAGTNETRVFTVD